MYHRHAILDQIADRVACRLFRIVRSVILVVFPVTVLLFHIRFFRTAFSNPAHSYFNFPYLRFPSLRSRTWIFRTCIFHPYTFCHFVLHFYILAFSSTCNFSDPVWTCILFLFKMQRIQWTQMTINTEVLCRADMDSELMRTVITRQIRFVGHVLIL